MSKKGSKKKEPIIHEEEIEFPKFNESVGKDLEQLCDRVSCKLEHTLNSHKELAEFKQSLINEKLPPNVIVALSSISGETLKNGIDLKLLLDQLIRIVQKNSYQLQEHMPQFMKLGEDYKRKCNQLDVALKKLELQNEDFKRIQHKEILQNWELLFTKAQLAKSHGRRWKYRMFEFKEKAKKGGTFLQDYFRELLDQEDGITPTKEYKMSQPEESDTSTIKSKELSKSFIKESTKTSTEEEQEEEQEEYQESLDDKDNESLNPVELKDVSVGTSDSNYSQKLTLRIYNPKGIGMFGDLACRVVYGAKSFVTNCLDKSEIAKIEEQKYAEEIDSKLETKPILKGKGGLIGKKKNKQNKALEKSPEELKQLEQEKKLRELKRYESITIDIPAEVISAESHNSNLDFIKIDLITTGESSELLGQCIIDMEELNALDLPIYFEPIYRGDLISAATSPDLTQSNDELFPSLEPMIFPVYDMIQQSKDGNRIQMAQLPIACFWNRTEYLMKFDRAVETLPFYSIIEEMTGIDLNVVSKEDLTRDMVDKSLSPRPITPSLPSILQSDHDAILQKLQNDLVNLEQDYDKKLKELEIKLSEVAFEGTSSRAHRAYHKDCGVSPIFVYRSVPGSRRTTTGDSSSISFDSRKDKSDKDEAKRSAKSRDTLSTGGLDDQEEILYKSIPEAPLIETKLERPVRRQSRTRPMNPQPSEPLPENFVQRASVYSELSTRHQEDLREKVRKEVSGAIEMKLNELFHLHENLTEDEVSEALADLSFPAIFMPFTNSSGTIYNPRAHHYFHPMGLKYLRISQAPSIFKLPPIKQNQMSILNMLDIGNEIKITKMFDKSLADQNISNMIRHLPQETKPMSVNNN